MRGNSFGKMISMTSFGESHGEALGVVIDGVPPGLDFSLSDLQAALDKRAPGKIEGTTARKEPDTAEVLSGVMDGKTLGTPIAVIVRNTNQRSQDYNKLKENYRPGHADKTTMHKYGIRDHRGGGRSSGRETLARVIGGYFASLVIPNVLVKGYISKMGDFEFKGEITDLKNQKFDNYHFPGLENEEKIKDYLLKLKKDGESCGGRVSIIVDQCPVGLGEPAFDKLKADLAKGILSIGACVAFSFGLGEKMADLPGSIVSVDAKNFGGIEGGISNGERILMNCVFKPTSTIGEKAKEGRHDPCIIPRAIPVVEAMVKFVLADHYLRQKAYGLSNE
ncbi:MAG: chorismate synthase [Bdellovibrionales bacterium CG12_big_fil_rev_8_21_14_0_65_38_15]|nr:MAG: chorismate synthase [Bdellovibrionales bacterium CG22_combo_CG10-13_8_21_14_all_38_13]PIQ54613.1 MAG: chorismate synthase [Bdellovibrionales bacterium CG12_big_fil_rev_8_21_14_0_65_38_15]PIR29994.1 MAG: chorismate synthase [Bdellovibrionales bacterium CG11_big_fil_rev_8_21_14_0_20_38_13]